jgi:hypothetical protein
MKGAISPHIQLCGVVNRELSGGISIGDADVALVEVEGTMLCSRHRRRSCSRYLPDSFADKVAELARLSNSLLEIREQGGEGFKICGTSLDNCLRQSLYWNEETAKRIGYKLIH